jgi:hypothetical protein
MLRSVKVNNDHSVRGRLVPVLALLALKVLPDPSFSADSLLATVYVSCSINFCSNGSAAWKRPPAQKCSESAWTRNLGGYGVPDGQVGFVHKSERALSFSLDEGVAV